MCAWHTHACVRTGTRMCMYVWARTHASNKMSRDPSPTPSEVCPQLNSLRVQPEPPLMLELGPQGACAQNWPTHFQFLNVMLKNSLL